MENKKHILESLKKSTENTLMRTLGIEYTDVSEGYLEATMPVTTAHHQPMGLLHGGATAALVESVASAGSFVFKAKEATGVVGIEIACNHLRPVRSGKVTAYGKMVHRGKTLHHWTVEVKDESGKLICLGKLTNMILYKKT